MHIDGNRKRDSEWLFPAHVISRYILIFCYLWYFHVCAKSIEGVYVSKRSDDSNSEFKEDDFDLVKVADTGTNNTVLARVTIADNSAEIPDESSVEHLHKGRVKPRQVISRLDKIKRYRVLHNHQSNLRKLITLDECGKLTSNYILNSTHVNIISRFNTRIEQGMLLYDYFTNGIFTSSTNRNNNIRTCKHTRETKSMNQANVNNIDHNNFRLFNISGTRNQQFQFPQESPYPLAINVYDSTIYYTSNAANITSSEYDQDNNLHHFSIKGITPSSDENPLEKFGVTSSRGDKMSRRLVLQSGRQGIRFFFITTENLTSLRHSPRENLNSDTISSTITNTKSTTINYDNGRFDNNTTEYDFKQETSISRRNIIETSKTSTALDEVMNQDVSLTASATKQIPTLSSPKPNLQTNNSLSTTTSGNTSIVYTSLSSTNISQVINTKELPDANDRNTITKQTTPYTSSTSTTHPRESASIKRLSKTRGSIYLYRVEVGGLTDLLIHQNYQGHDIEFSVYNSISVQGDVICWSNGANIYCSKQSPRINSLKLILGYHNHLENSCEKDKLFVVSEICLVADGWDAVIYYATICSDGSAGFAGSISFDLFTDNPEPEVSYIYLEDGSKMKTQSLQII